MTIREFLDAYDRLTADGWLTCDEALLLAAWADATTGTIVEIGSYKGRSAMLLAQLPGARKLVCVDPWEDGFSSDLSGGEILLKFVENMSSLPGLHNYQAFREKVEDWEPVPAGFVYLDGDHTPEGTRRQIAKALLCHPQVIAIHDVNDSGEGKLIRDVALEMLGPWKERIGRLAVWEVKP